MHAVVVNGLNDKKHDFYFERFKEHDIQPEQYCFGWQSKRPSADLVRDLSKRVFEKVEETGEQIYLVGLSAGFAGSLVCAQLNPDLVCGVVGVCGIAIEEESPLLTRRLFGSDSRIHREVLAMIDPTALDLNKIVSVRSKADGLIRPSSTVIGDHRVVDIYTPVHGRAIRRALMTIVPELLLDMNAK